MHIVNTIRLIEVSETNILRRQDQFQAQETDMTYHQTTDCFVAPRAGKNLNWWTRTASLLKRWLEAIVARHRKRRQQRIDRQAFQQMRLLDDDILDDIGVTRSNVEWASQLPIHQSASQALHSTMKRARPRIRP